MCRFTFAIILFLLFQTPLFSSDEIKYAAGALYLPAGSDIAGIGDCGIAVARHSSTSFWNPAVSAYLQKRELSAEYANLYEGLSEQGCFSVTLPLQQSVAASLTYLPFYTGSIEYHDTLPGTYEERLNDQSLRADGTFEGVFQNYQNVLTLSLGKCFSTSLPRQPGISYPLPLDIGIGCTFKGYWQTMNPGGKVRLGMNTNIDVGVLVRISADYDFSTKSVVRYVTLGFSSHDILGSPVAWVHSPIDYQEPVKESHYFGIAYTDLTGFLNGNWLCALELHKTAQFSYHWGIEGVFWNMVAFRAGLSDKTPTLGAGITYRNFFLDYALRFDELAWSMVRVTLGGYF